MFESTRPGRLLSVLGIMLLLAACQTTNRTAPNLVVPASGSRVLMMTPDVQLFEMQASGVLEPKSEWTETARTHVVAALSERIRQSGANVIDYANPSSLPDELTHARLIDLHRAVGEAIRQHWAGPLALPSKKGQLEWTLGPGVQTLRERYEADYAFFLHIHDSYASAGRGAVVLIGLLFNAPVTGGHQVGFVSLVDLKTGQVVWANQSINTGADLRVPKSADEVVVKLLEGFPI